MNTVEKMPFDLKMFLVRVGGGKTRAEFRERQIIFSQGDPADAVFYIGVVGNDMEGALRPPCGVAGRDAMSSS